MYSIEDRGEKRHMLRFAKAISKAGKHGVQQFSERLCSCAHAQSFASYAGMRYLKYTLEHAHCTMTSR